MKREEAVKASEALCDVFPNVGSWEGDACTVTGITKEGKGPDLVRLHHNRTDVARWFALAEVDPCRLCAGSSENSKGGD